MTRETRTEILHKTEQSVTASPETGECERAFKFLEQVVIGGLRHGFFECTVVCDVIKGKKRRLVIKAGESHQFIIPLEELNSA